MNINNFEKTTKRNKSNNSEGFKVKGSKHNRKDSRKNKRNWQEKD